MAPHKVSAVILRTQAYRETSLLMHCCTDQFGLVHGIAKGVRRGGRESGLLERGFLVEMLVYRKPHRDLHLLTRCNVLEYSGGVRADLIKSAVRDAWFEMMIRTIATDHPHPELYRFLLEYLHGLEQYCTAECFPALLWKFIHDFAVLLGFAFDWTRCGRCKGPLERQRGATLLISEGTCACESCICIAGPSYLPAAVLDVWRTGINSSARDCTALSEKEKTRVTDLLASYIAYHCNISNKFNALEFLASLHGPG